MIYAIFCSGASLHPPGSCRDCRKNKINSLFLPFLSSFTGLQMPSLLNFSLNAFLYLHHQLSSLDYPLLISIGMILGSIFFFLFLCSLLRCSSFPPSRWEQSLLIHQVVPYPSQCLHGEAKLNVVNFVIAANYCDFNVCAVFCFSHPANNPL